ncbi:MAG: hypothetical protein KA998_03015 [Rickettsiaceae bacterium]|nr:hypothetical protein [Rickettsiaceae bacterium]
MKNKVKVGNNEEDFKALESSRLDTSDLILISYKILNDQLGKRSNEELINVTDNYFKGTYIEALYNLRIISNTLEDRRLYNILEKDKIESAIRNDSPQKDVSRRYFETKFSEHL